MVACKDRLPPQKERRNMRERNRVHQVNMGFDRLRDTVARVVSQKKMSKADTLRQAARYIAHLHNLLSSHPIPGDAFKFEDMDGMEEVRQMNSFSEPSPSFFSPSSCCSAAPSVHATSPDTFSTPSYTHTPHFINQTPYSSSSNSSPTSNYTAPFYHQHAGMLMQSSGLTEGETHIHQRREQQPCLL